MKNVRLLKLSIVVVPFVLSSCASIIEGSGQNVRLSTNTTHPSNCIVKNERGSSSVVAPTSITVKRSKTDLDIQCSDKAGHEGNNLVQSDLEGWWWGNVALLSPLGIFIDAVSGAMWEYPKDIQVPMQRRQ